MGFFDFLLGSKKQTNVEVIPDRIWMNTEAKFAGLAKEVVERSTSEAVAILLVAHFPDVLAHLEQLADQRTSGVPLKAVLARNLNTDLAASLNLDESAVIDIIVGERHPMASEDDRLEAFADELPCRCRFTYHISLEDPVVEIFAGAWVQNVLSKLGMSEEEAIEGPITSRNIRKTQQKIERRAIGTVDAESAAQWMEKNCPDLVNR